MKAAFLFVVCTFIAHCAHAEDKDVVTFVPQCVGGKPVIYAYQSKEDQHSGNGVLAVQYRLLSCIPIKIFRFNFIAGMSSPQLVSWQREDAGSGCVLTVDGLLIPHRQMVQKSYVEEEQALIRFATAFDTWISVEPDEEIVVRYACPADHRTRAATVLSMRLAAGNEHDPSAVASIAVDTTKVRPDLELLHDMEIKGEYVVRYGGRST